MKNTLALPAKDHEGIGAKLMTSIIKTIEKCNGWQIDLLLAIAIWEVLYALR